MNEDFLSGVIEGFYGQPWSRLERLELFDWMEIAHLNAYLYAPKDDLKLRARWREPYSADEIASEAKLLGDWLDHCDAAPGWPGLGALAPARSRKSRHGAILLPFRTLLAAIDSAR